MTGDARARQIRQIKVAARALFAADEAAERDCYAAITGVRSCRAMTDAQLRQVGDYLARATGHKPDRPIALRPSSSSALAARLAPSGSRFTAEPEGVFFPAARRRTVRLIPSPARR